MKKLLFALFICVSNISCAQKEADKTYNLDLEEINETTGLPNGWGLGNVMTATIPNDNTLKAYRIDSSIKQHCRYSLLIDWNKNYKEWTASNYVIDQTFEGKNIKLTGYIKTEDVTGSAGLWMRIDGANNMLAFDNMQSRPVKGTTDWKEYTIELEYNADEAKRIVVGGLIIGPGKMWMDDLHITIDGKDISEAPIHKNNDSGIQNIALNDQKIKNLTNLGMLWGFIKYYHASVNKGKYNMDEELFRILPKILNAKNTNDANTVMEKWVDEFGKPSVCKNCIEPVKSVNTKLLPDYGYLFTENNFEKSLIEKLEYIKRNRNTGETNYYVSATPGVNNPIFTNELPYNDLSYPDARIRLLALYRFWNMVQYFFPDKDMIGEDWNKVLPEFIPVFCNAANAAEYEMACLKLIVRIHDTHASNQGGCPEIENMKGQFMTPFQAKFIENKLVVTDYYYSDNNITDKIKIGDVIEKIDGVLVSDLVKKYLPITSGSNIDAQLRDLPKSHMYLLRSNKPEAQLTIIRNGKSQDVTILRRREDGNMEKLDYGDKVNDGFKMLNDDIGYIFPGKLRENDLDSIKKLFSRTKGIIIDMRCYPSVFMAFSYAVWLKAVPSPFVKFAKMNLDIPGTFEMTSELSNGSYNIDFYKGKVVIIVNATTQSSAEYQTMALSTGPNVTVIGSTTAGADGNVSEIILPGGIKTMFSGIRVLYPDNTETQRKGVKMDRVVKPTIEGIKEGRDELLEEAIKIIKG